MREWKSKLFKAFLFSYFLRILLYAYLCISILIEFYFKIVHTYAWLVLLENKQWMVQNNKVSSKDEEALISKAHCPPTMDLCLGWREVSTFCLRCHWFFGFLLKAKKLFAEKKAFC